MHAMKPGPAHNAFMAKLDEAEKTFAGTLPPIERLAIAAQFVGQLIGEIDDYAPADVMQTVAHAMEAGNAHATGKSSGRPFDPSRLLIKG